MNLKLAISPCPNDTFMFYKLLHDASLRTEINPDVEYADIEELNHKVFSGSVDICKMSYNAYPGVANEYQILSSGSALGRNCGPLLIAKSPIPEDELSSKTVAIPGINTTANFLLQFAYPNMTRKTEVLFSEIENGVLGNDYDCGLIIHENRFTYEDKGLFKIKDLGEHWENKTGYPIPLGCIVIKRKLIPELKQKINLLLHNSIQFAFDHPEDTMSFVAHHAQEMNRKVMIQHIKLYVNEFSLNLGKEGEDAVNHLFSVKNQLQTQKFSLQDTFVRN